MDKALILVFVLALAGCSTGTPRQDASACAVHEASYDCQVQRYHDVNVQ